MIETKKIKSTQKLEDIISTITNLAADMEDDVDMILALFRMGNQRIMPILRNDLKQRYCCFVVGHHCTGTAR